jgi:hypothetical protein
MALDAPVGDGGCPDVHPPAGAGDPAEDHDVDVRQIARLGMPPTLNAPRKTTSEPSVG